ncbi:MAG: DUF1080 domain-containing protein [Draconibacterium sp.]
MKKLNSILVAVFALLAVVSTAQNAQKDFNGMWTIEIEGGSVGWLGVNDNKGYLDAELLWQGGSVLPVSNVYFTSDNSLVVTRTREVEKSAERRHTLTQTFTFERKGDKLSGTMTEPARDGLSISKLSFKGWRLPMPPAAPNLSTIKYGEPIQLFNGKDLTGWRLINPKQANGFKVVNGELVNDPVNPEGQRVNFGNLQTEKEFEDFRLTLEVNVPEHSNSGVYLRGMYEVQVVDSYGAKLDSHNMGAVYSRITPTVAAEKKGGEWQSLDIILCNRHVSVNLNGTKIIDNQPVYGPTGGAMQADVFKAGPIYLQGDHGKVLYRNMVLTPIIK